MTKTANNSNKFRDFYNDDYNVPPDMRAEIEQEVAEILKKANLDINGEELKGSDKIAANPPLRTKKPAIITMLTIIIIFLTACNTPTEPTTPINLPMLDMTLELADHTEIEVRRFNLGDLPLTAADSEILFPISGIIAAPPTEQIGGNPLVVLLHGRKGIDTYDDPSYAGFDFLVQQLAAEGYIAVSININAVFDMEFEDFERQWISEIFNAHLDFLTAANQENSQSSPNYGLDLTGRINLEKIHLIGHSRGGALIDYLARSDSRIGSLLRVGTYVFPHETPPPDLPTGIIVSEFDGDLEDHFGQFVFDEILRNAKNQAFVSLVYLRGGNHFYFNREFDTDDRETLFFNVAQENRNRWINREQQEHFLRNYAVAFLDVVTQNRQPWGVFSPSEPQPTTMFGLDVIASTYFHGMVSILDSVQSAGAVSATEHIQRPERFGNPHFFRHPNGSAESGLPPLAEGLRFISLIWDGEGTANFTPLQNDFSDFESLSFYLAVDSSNAANSPNQDQALSISLTDNAGISQKIVIPTGTSALTFHPGMEMVLPGMSEDLLEEFDFHPWQGFMPLGELRIPLSLFANLNLAEISEITLYFDQTPTGAIMLSDVFLH